MAIVKMKKVSLVVLDAERKESLKSLRKMGLVHLEAIEGQSAKLTAFREAFSQSDKAISILSEVKTKKNEIKQVSLSNEEALNKAKEIIACFDKKKALYDSINQDVQELSRFDNWGAVSLEDLQSLAEKNVFLYLYEIPVDKYALIGKDSKTVLVNTTGKTARFLLISDCEISERPADFPAEAYSVPLPRASTLQIRKDIEEHKNQIASLDQIILQNKKYTDAIKKFKKNLATDIEFENVYSGMAHEESETETDNSVKLAWISGYVPVDSYGEFKKSCVANQWAYSAQDAQEDDFAVPTKLKNNKLISLIYPLMDFLDVTPGYNEFDISGWFLLFFSIFFGMIFADAGYGAIICVAAIFFIIKSAISKKKVPSVFGLMLILGLCTTIYGALTCSWFGLDTEQLPDWMVNISFAPISKAKVGEDIANTNQKIFCFVLALIQLSIAHIKCFFKDVKSAKCLGDLGALMELWGMFYVVMSLVVDGTKYPLLSITSESMYLFGVVPVQFLCLGVLGAGFVLNFIFSNYEGSVGKSVLESCKNIISVLLGVVNVFSDIVSYIRLWAVALAGAAISSTVNSMAGPMFGKLALFVFGIILVLFGHGLNNILNLLSVIVHGVRLNTLEFSQHLGMAWTGTKYKPFMEKTEE